MLNAVEETGSYAVVAVVDEKRDFTSACCPIAQPANKPAVKGAPTDRPYISADATDTAPPVIREPKYKHRKSSMTEIVEWFSHFLMAHPFPNQSMFAELATRLNRQVSNVGYCRVILRMPSGTVELDSPHYKTVMRHHLKLRQYPVSVNGQNYGFIELGAPEKVAINPTDDAQIRVIAQLLAVFIHQAHTSREMVALTRDYYLEQVYHDIKAQALVARYSAEKILNQPDTADLTRERLHELALMCHTSVDQIVQHPLPLMSLSPVDLAQLLDEVLKAVYSSMRTPGYQLDVQPSALPAHAYPDLLKYVLYGLFNTLIDLQLLRIIEGKPVIQLDIVPAQGVTVSWELSIRFRVPQNPETEAENTRLGHLGRWLRKAQSLFTVQGWQATRRRDGDVQELHAVGLAVTG